MKEITIRELRQNPAEMVRNLEAGEPYALTMYRRTVAMIFPVQSSTTVAPPRRRDGANTAAIPRHELCSASSVDDLLADEKGSW